MSLNGSLCVRDFSQSGTVLGTSKLVDISDCALVSERLGFDARRICAAHNLVILSRHADSISMKSLEHFLSGMIDSKSLEQFVVDAVFANPHELNGTMINEITQLVKFRDHETNDASWQESVLVSL